MKSPRYLQKWTSLLSTHQLQLSQIVSLPCDACIFFFRWRFISQFLLSFSKSRRCQRCGDELSNLFSILLVLWIFPFREKLCNPCACLEKDQVTEGTHATPIVPSPSCCTRPDIQRDPDSLLRSIVWLARICEETSCVESALK